MVVDFFPVLMFFVVANGRFLSYSEKRGGLFASLRLCVFALTQRNAEVQRRNGYKPARLVSFEDQRNAKAQRRKGAKELIRGERAQLQTLEGFAAALLMVGTVYLAVTSVTLSVPQTELHIDAQLKTYGRDALAILDAQIPPENEEEYYTSSLKNSVVGWMNGAEGATNWETDKFAPSNPGTNQTSYRFKFRTPAGCNYNHTFNVSIPNNTRISHAYVTLTGMPRLDTGICDDPQIGEKLPLVLDSPPGTPDHFGCSIAHGYVNDDTIPDMVVGAYGNNSSSGVAYIYYGNNSSDVWGNGWGNVPDITITNPGKSGDCFGWAVACGDVVGDATDDIIIGAPWNISDPIFNPWSAGMVYVYNGTALANTPDPDVAIPTQKHTGAPVDGLFGYSLACGNVSGDFHDDLIVGAPTIDNPDRGVVFVFIGNNLFSESDNRTLYNPNPYNGSKDFFGISVASFDLSGDGMDDIIIGENHSNRTYIRFGATSLPSLINTAGNEMNLTLSGESGSGFGLSVSSAGDVNKDGVDDLIVGAPDKNTTHIFYGGALLDNTSDINLTGASGSRFGISVSAAGDVDSDGYSGVVIGIPNSTSTSAFYDVDLDIGQIDLSGPTSFGTIVSHIGDVNNDSIPDIAVGAPDAGEVYVYTPRFPEMPWLGVGNETEIATNNNGTKVWEYTTVIKTDNGNPSGTYTNRTNKTLLIYREITTDVNLSMYVRTTSATNADISVNGVKVANASIPDTGGVLELHDGITLRGDITEWRIGDNNITINATPDTLDIGLDDGTNKSLNNRMMINISLPITQPFKTTETTPDFASAINNWMDAHPLHGNLSDTGNISWTTQWVTGNETGWIVPFILHSNSSGVIDVTNLNIKATASLEENLYTLLPNFIEYNVVLAYLKMITKGHVYTFSDNTYSNTSTFDGNESKTLSVILPENTTEVYIAKMTVSGSANGTPTAERVSVSSERQSDPCIAVNNSSAMLVWTADTSPMRVYSAVRDISAGPWSSAVRVNASSNPPQHSGTLGMNNTGAFVAWVGGADQRINYTEDGNAIGVNTSSDAQTEPSLAVNSTGHVFLAWTENGGVHYSEYDHAVWSPATTVNSSVDAQSSPSLAVNTTGWAFVAWVEDATIMYSEYNRTTWLNATKVSTAADQSSPTIAANDSGWVFAASVHGTGASAQVYYSYYNRTNQSWSTPVAVNNTLGGQTKPDLAIDSSNHAHVVWEQLGKIYYSNNTGSGWSAAVRIADDGTNPTIAVNSSDAPHIAWEHGNEIWYVKGAVETSYYGNYPTLPYIRVNGSEVWEYNITESNYNGTPINSMTLCNGSSLTKTFDIDETVEGPVTLSICAGGNDSSFDLYVNDEYANSGYTTPNTEHQNITTSRNLWQRNDNEVRINVTSGCASWNYTNSIGNSNDWYYNQSNRTNLCTNNTWMIRLYGHEYRGTQTIGTPNTDFSDALNGCLNPNATSDQKINFTIHSTNGNLTLDTLRIYYYIRGNKTEVAQTRVITHNVPPSDTVTVTRLVTIHDSDRPDETEAEKRIPDTGVNPNIPIANMVEVRLELWYR